MPLPDRSEPLNPDERRAILTAVTTGGRSQRSVADDPTIRGTHDQIRAVVRDAIRDDPSLLARFPKLSRRPAPEIRAMDVVDADGESAEQTAAAALVAAGVPLSGVRMGRVVTTVRSRVHFVRNPDGSFAAVRAQQADTRVEWLPVEAVSPLTAAEQGTAEVRPVGAWPALGSGTRRMSFAVALALVGLLLVGGAALVKLAKVSDPVPVVGVAHPVDSATGERP